MDITKMTQAELEQLAQHGSEIIEPIQRAVANGTSGTYRCPYCPFEASWVRDGADWKAECECGWNAAGRLGREYKRADQ